MKKAFSQITTAIIILSVLGILLGIAMIMWPGESVIASGVVLGIVLIVEGIGFIVLDVRARKFYMPLEGLIIAGILDIILGVLLLLNPNSMFVLLPFTVGTWIIVSSIVNIKAAATMKGTDTPWVLLIILNVISIILACFIMFYPAPFAGAIMMWCGIMIIVYGIVTIIDMIILKKDAKQYESLIKDKVAEIKSAVNAAANGQNPEA